MPPSRMPLDGSWEFVADPGDRFRPDGLPAGTPITVPGAWEAQVGEPNGIVRGWYRRSFRLPGSWPPGSLVLRFECVISRARVWLDGRLVGAQDDPYLPFEIEVGPAWPGATHDLVVWVENPLNALTEFPAFGGEAVAAALDRLGGASYEGLPHGKQDWYTSTSGLLGSVTAECVPDPRVSALWILPDLAASAATVRWRLAGARVATPGRIRLRVLSPAGRLLGEAAFEAARGSAVIPIPDPIPWDLWQPALYVLEGSLEGDRGAAQAHGGGQPVQVIERRFGMRSISVRDGSVLLNGRPVYLRGALDQDFWPAGLSNAPSVAALRAQVATAREMGLNLLRCHVKIPGPAYLDVTDEAGILVWCELPSWRRFGPDTARTARRMLARMVETMGHHPSIAAWTIVNESWGMDLLHSARDRRWLRATAGWLKAADPTRLVVDNSACETADGSSFHLRTDLADYHAYRSMPDGVDRWRSVVAELATGPASLWSPHGDAARTGHEAIVMSEFGAWGLPRVGGRGAADSAGPWWWRTGGPEGPAGIATRFREQGLDRVWPDVDALAVATQERQADALALQVGELRRHAGITGFVVTELSDTAWEANGLLDFERRPKAFHDRLGGMLGPAVLIADPPRFDTWGGTPVTWEVTAAVASCGEVPTHAVRHPDAERRGTAGGHGDPETFGNLRLQWRLDLEGAGGSAGSAPIRSWPRDGSCEVARVRANVPDPEHACRGAFVATAVTGDGIPRARARRAVVVIPSSARRTRQPRRVAVIDPDGRSAIDERLRQLGHEIVAVDAADCIVAARLDRTLLAEVSRGGSALLLVRAVEAIADGPSLEWPLVARRRVPDQGTPSDLPPWQGDWISVFAWAVPRLLPGLDEGGLLGDGHAEIFPDLVLEWPDVPSAAAVVEAGLFAGWVRHPAALLVTFPQGAGNIIATTLRVAPEGGPVATATLESLVQRAATARGHLRARHALRAIKAPGGAR